MLNFVLIQSRRFGNQAELSLLSSDVQIAVARNAWLRINVVYVSEWRL